MQQLFLRTLATTISTAGVFVAPCMARGGDDWTRFDRDLEAFVKSASTSSDGAPALHGLVRAGWNYAPDTEFVATPAPGHLEDRNGAELYNVQVSIEGNVGERVGYRLQLEAADGTARLLDGFATWDACKYVRVTMGQFRAPLLWESQLADSDLLFILRSDPGQLFYIHNPGAMLSGSAGQFNWAASIQNGLDSVQEDYALCARVGVDAIGGGVGLHQGAYGAGSRTKLSLGAGLFNEQSQGDGKDGDVLAADAQLQMGSFAANATIAKYQEFTNPNASPPGFDIGARSESTAWNVSASAMVIEQKLELATRYQEINNALNEKDLTVGVNYYVDGRAVKLQVNASYIFSDNSVLDDSIRLGVGATVRV